jgi:hypothetical protein
VRHQSDIPEIRAGLQDRIVDICRQLLPRGRAEGGLWVAHNPGVAGEERKPPALKVRIAGGDIGAWTDWRNGRAGHKGDVIGLVAYLVGTDTKGALAWARDFLGLKALSREERAAMRFAAEARRRQDDRRAEQKRRWSLAEADRLYTTPQGHREYGPAFAATAGFADGTAAREHALAYLRARRCPLDEIKTARPDLTFRFSAATEWWKGAVWETDGSGRKFKARPGPSFPAIHTAMRAPIGAVTCCHVTFLDQLQPAKAPVSPAKLMFGEKKGTVIEIATGPSRTPFWQWGPETQAAPVIIAEGIETAASLAVELSAEARVWAAGDLSNIGNAPVHLPIVAEIYVARDNNHGNPQAQRQLDDALEKLEAHGRPLTVMNSPIGDDFNDLATGEGD